MNLVQTASKCVPARWKPLLRSTYNWVQQQFYPEYSKVDIIHYLAKRYSYKRYLEIATPTTGFKFGEIDRTLFIDCRRLLYRLPTNFSDGMPIDYSVEGENISFAIAEISKERHRFDLMLIDPFHTYDSSMRDLHVAFDLLSPGGAMVVHDCLPPEVSLATPHFLPGTWFGVTYAAFLDFALGRDDLRYITVDTDAGCGVVRKHPAKQHSRVGDRRRLAIIKAWAAIERDNHIERWNFFQMNRKTLLNLISVRKFRSNRHRLD